MQRMKFWKLIDKDLAWGERERGCSGLGGLLTDVSKFIQTVPLPINPNKPLWCSVTE